MKTIYLNTTLRVRPRTQVLDLQAYREQRERKVSGAPLPEPHCYPALEITPELPEPEAGPLERLTRWADAAASAALALGAVLILLSLL